ncbi:MAG: carboxypeptidase M32 [Candidatus Lokiarchaeota archaeon]|nr:carboxypeptidase M32 [Candidatus Lokiarchaeota archaeon]
MNAYEKLLKEYQDIVVIGSAQSVVHWDLETYMPPKGVKQRSEQLALLSRLEHRMITSDKIGKLLDEAEKDIEDMSQEQKRNLHLIRREYDEETALPEELVGDLSKQKAISVDTWKKAKAKKDWSVFEPELNKTIDLSVEKAEILMDIKGTESIYDTMIDDFEKGMTKEKIASVFSELRKGLVPLTQKCADVSSDVKTDFLKREVPIEIQKKIATDLATTIGYDTTSDEAAGRIDPTEHPFTTGYYDDVRITLNYKENNLVGMMYAALHEGGHALYERNMNPDWKYQPIGQAASFGIHESQSRFIENMLGRSPEFLDYYYPRLNELTDDLFSDIDKSRFAKAVNLVEPSKIRIEADEVTYSLHVIIRFEIEKALFGGEVEISELPQVWNDKYDEYLGVEVANDSEGVMQDTHWASGYYGYFPSYALGNVYDGMWLQKINKDMPKWQKNLTEGEVVPVVNWLTENVHHYGSLYDPADLIEEVVGEKPKAKPFLSYLDEKYASIFGF